MMCVNASVPVLPAQLDFVHISSVLKNRPFFGQPEGVPGCAPNTHAFGCWHRPQLRASAYLDGHLAAEIWTMENCRQNQCVK